MKLIKLIYSVFKKLRRTYYNFLIRNKAAKCGGFLKVNGKSRVNKQTFLGKNVSFNGLIISGNGKVEIGDNFHSGPDCLFITQIHNYDTGKTIPYDDTYIFKNILIENNVWLGSRVIILGGVTIGEGAIIQAGSCVVSNVPKYSIAGGHPAKVFKTRNIEHYEKCKQEGKFH